MGFSFSWQLTLLSGWSDHITASLLAFVNTFSTHHHKLHLFHCLWNYPSFTLSEKYLPCSFKMAFECIYLSRTCSPSAQHTCWLSAGLRSEDTGWTLSRYWYSPRCNMCSLSFHEGTSGREGAEAYLTLWAFYYFSKAVRLFKKYKTSKEEWSNTGNSGIQKKITVSVQERLVLQLLFIRLRNRLCLYSLFPNSHWSLLLHQLMPHF